MEANVHSSEEDLVGTSDDDEEFVVPAKYVRITTYAELLSHRIQLPVYSHNCEQVQLDPSLVRLKIICLTKHSIPKSFLFLLINNYSGI